MILKLQASCKHKKRRFSTLFSDLDDKIYKIWAPYGSHVDAEPVRVTVFGTKIQEDKGERSLQGRVERLGREIQENQEVEQQKREVITRWLVNTTK